MSLLDAWYDKSQRTRLWLWPLWPVSRVYAALARRRRIHLEQRRARNPTLPPVIVIGNIALGGTGKTPLIIALARLLLAHGLKPGIVSRGYGGSKEPASVTALSRPEDVGDEAVLVHRQTGCPVRVDAQRLRGVEALCVQSACDVILSDDGLQHYALPRALEIVVIDGERLLGNGHCLPAGPLREPPSRLREVDWLVFNGGTAGGQDTVARQAGLPANFPVRTAMTLEPACWVNLASGERVALTALPLRDSGVLHALAGIGNPQRFFDTVRGLGYTPLCHPFSDHYRFTAHDLQFAAAHTLVMTSKDAVKCEVFAGTHCWYLEVEARLAPAFTTPLLAAVHALIAAREVHPGIE